MSRNSVAACKNFLLNYSSSFAKYKKYSSSSFVLLRNFHLGCRALHSNGRNADCSQSQIPFTPLDNVSMEYTCLSNGLRVASLPSPGFHCALAFAIKTGSRYERNNFSGVCDLMSYLPYDCTSNFSCQDISELRDSWFYSLQGERENFIHVVKFDRRHLKKMYRLLADMVLRPIILDEDFFTACQRLIWIYRRICSQFYQVYTMSELIHEAAFHKSTLGRPLHGGVTTLNEMTSDKIYNFMKHSHTPDRMAVVAVGIPHDELVELSEECIVNDDPIWADKDFNGPDPAIVCDTVPEYKGGAIKMAMNTTSPLGFRVKCAHIAVALESCSCFDDDYLEVRLLRMLMGSGVRYENQEFDRNASSRLNQNVIKKHHWILRIMTHNYSYAQTGVFYIHATIALAGLIGDVISILCQELINMTSVSEQELEMVKSKLKSHLAMNLEERIARCWNLSHQVLHSAQYKPLQGILERIDAIDVDDMHRVARRLLSSTPAVAVEGIANDTKEYQDLLEKTLELSAELQTFCNSQ